MKIIDIAEQQIYAEYKSEFDRFIDIEIKNKDFKLKKNYLNINPADYVAMTCLVNKNAEIVGFSALQQAPFPQGTLRALNKLFYGSSVREMGYHSFPSLATQYMLPYQLEVAQKKDARFVFVSLQSDMKRDRFAKSYEEVLNRTSPFSDWKLMDGLYNTCRISGDCLNEHPSCWQRVICLSFKSSLHEFNLPKKIHE